MDVVTMHSSVDLELNKINSNLYDILQAPEKDYFLNRAQERFIKDRYGPKSNPKQTGFEMSQKRIDDLRNLLVPNYFDKAFLVDPADFDYSGKQRFFFPEDYMFLASHRSKVYFNECAQVVPITNTQVLTYFILPLPITITSFSQFAINYTTGTPVGPTIVSGFNYTEDDKSLFIIDLLNQFNSKTTGWQLYYSKYKDIVSEGNIIGVNLGTGAALSYTLDGETFIPLTNLTKNYYYLTGTGGSDTVVTNRFAQQDDVYTMQQDPFNKTNPYSPLIIIHTNCIDVFKDQTFFVKEIAISYLRKPKLISLSLNQSCELAEETHSEIVRDAVNLMLEDLDVRERLQSSLGVEVTNE
jgi:hypothetical protein